MDWTNFFDLLQDNCQLREDVEPADIAKKRQIVKTKNILKKQKAVDFPALKL